MPIEFVPAKNSTGPLSQFGLASCSEVKTNEAGAGKILPLAGEVISKTAGEERCSRKITRTGSDSLVALRLSYATALSVKSPSGYANQTISNGAFVATPIRESSKKNFTSAIQPSGSSATAFILRHVPR